MESTGLYKRVASGVPLSTIRSLEPRAAKQELLSLAKQFEDIDEFIKDELETPHERKNGSPVYYTEDVKKQFSSLCKEHEEDQVFDYLGNKTFDKYWNIVFASSAPPWINHPSQSRMMLKLASADWLIWQTPCHKNMIGR